MAISPGDQLKICYPAVAPSGPGAMGHREDSKHTSPSYMPMEQSGIDQPIRAGPRPVEAREAHGAALISSSFSRRHTLLPPSTPRLRSILASLYLELCRAVQPRARKGTWLCSLWLRRSVP